MGNDAVVDKTAETQEVCILLTKTGKWHRMNVCKK